MKRCKYHPNRYKCSCVKPWETIKALTACAVGLGFLIALFIIILN